MSRGWIGGGVVLAQCAKPINRLTGRKKNLPYGALKSFILQRALEPYFLPLVCTWNRSKPTRCNAEKQ